MYVGQAIESDHVDQAGLFARSQGGALVIPKGVCPLNSVGKSVINW